MKKLSLLLFALPLMASAQTNFVWEKTDSIPKTKAQIYTDTKMFIADTWKSAQNVIQNDDKDAGLILIKGNTIIKKYGFGTNTYTYGYSVIFRMKENKFRIEIKDIYCDDAYFSGSNGIQQIKKIGPFTECPDDFTIWTSNISCDNAMKIMFELSSNMQSIVTAYSEYIQKPSAADDW